jgi:hypothetical protein
MLSKVLKTNGNIRDRRCHNGHRFWTYEVSARDYKLLSAIERFLREKQQEPVACGDEVDQATFGTRARELSLSPFKSRQSRNVPT